MQILLTPGHKESNVSVWVTKDRVLYTGDCLISRYLQSLERLRPVRAVLKQSIAGGRSPTAER